VESAKILQFARRVCILRYSSKYLLGLMNGRRHQILRSLEACVLGQFLGEPGNRKCAWAKAFSTGLLPRGFVSPGMCVGGGR
jgi:hypothetical protein